MASYRKKGANWEVQIARYGIRKSRSFVTKAQAVAWATKTEADIMAGKRGAVTGKTFGDLLERYRAEVSVTKRGERWESLRIGLLLRDELAKVCMSDLNASHIAAWRDRRLRSVSPASVRREWTILSHACAIAVKEWCWLPENPMTTVRRPAPAKPRTRLISANEIERLLFALGYDHNTTPETATSRVGAALLFAIETAMRSSEIVELTWERVNMVDCVARLELTKNGTSREVPLSPEALRILQQLEAVKTGTVFRIGSTQSLDSLFRKAKGRAMIEGLHFHDSRHEAITRLAKKLDVLDLARMVGHRDLKMLLIYYNESAADIARKLA